MQGSSSNSFEQVMSEVNPDKYNFLFDTLIKRGYLSMTATTGTAQVPLLFLVRCYSFFVVTVDCAGGYPYLDSWSSYSGLFKLTQNNLLHFGDDHCNYYYFWSKYNIA